MSKVIICLSLVFNFIVIAVATWAWAGGAVALFWRYGIDPHHVRLATQYEVLDIQPGDTVFLGDSITEGGMWHELFPKTKTHQRGIGGDVTVGVLARLGVISKAKPAQVFLLIGTNDLFRGITQDEIVKNILTIIDRIHSDSPKTDIFVQSILPRAAKYKEPIESLNKSLESAILGKAQWVNLYPLFLDKARDSIDDSLSNDELHLLGKGYLIWRDAISHLVNQG